MRNSISVAWIAALALVVLVAPAFAGPRSYTVYRAQSPPKLDGSFDDECWRAVPWETGFTLLGGSAVGPPFQTQFAMVWDDQCLYVAVRALEPEMSNLVARAPRGSNELFSDDRIELSLGSESDLAHWHQLVMNSRGRGLDFAWEAKKIMSRRTLPESAPWRWACSRKGIFWEVGMAIPLAVLNMEAREGAALFGNVARSRAVEQPVQYRTTWTALASDFAEPNAFGHFRLAGTPPPEAAARSLAATWNLDAVTTILGDRFEGAVIGLDENGWLRMKVPEIRNEVRLDARYLDRVELAFGNPPGAGDRVTLANSDCVLGEIRSMDTERTVVSNPMLGDLTFPTTSLSEIRLGAAARRFLDAPFEQSDMAPWMVVEGNWSVVKGRLVASSAGAIAAALPQDGPVTFETEIEPIGMTGVKYEVILFASDSDRRNLRYGVAYHYEEYQGLFRVYNRPPAGKGNWVQAFRFVRNPRGGQFRCDYNPKDGAVRAWHDMAAEGPFTARDAPKEGRYVLFIAQSPLAVKRLRVLPDIADLGGSAERAAGPVAVAMTNGDRTSARSVTFSDGRFSIKSDYGEIQLEPGRIASVHFAGHEGSPIAHDAAAVRVATTEGCLALISITLSPERLAGRSEIFGAVSIPRECVRSIDFRRAPP